jgi:hypothetical protein
LLYLVRETANGTYERLPHSYKDLLAHLIIKISCVPRANNVATGEIDIHSIP